MVSCKWNKLFMPILMCQIILNSANERNLDVTFPIYYCQNETTHDEEINLVISKYLPNYHLDLNKSILINCEPESLKEISNIDQIFKNGAIKIENNIHNLEQYCFRSFNENSTISIAIQLCKPKCTIESPCIRKCCPMHQVYDYSLKACGDEHEESYWKPTFYKLKLNPQEEMNCLERLSQTDQKNLKPQFLIDENILNIDDNSTHLMFSIDVQESLGALFKLLENGSLGIFQDDEHYWKSFDSFCIDGLRNFSENEEFYLGLEDNQVIILFNSTQDDEYNDERDSQEDDEIKCLGSGRDLIETIYCIALYVSSGFLLLTVIVFLLNYEKLNLHMMVMLSYVFTSFFALLFMATSKLPIVYQSENDSEKAPTLSCVVIGILAHFFSLAHFFWMTVINVDLWWTFRNSMPTNKKMNSRDFKIYFAYMGFAFGIPLMNIIIGIGLDAYHKSVNGVIQPGMCVYKNFINPNYGHDELCFISSQDHADGIYYYYWIGILLLINWILFLSTLYILFACKIRKKMIERRLSKQKESFKIFAKLFIVMGVFWCSEFISWVAVPKDEISCWAVVVFDMINFSQGFAIFVIFVCKVQTMRDLAKKYSIFRILFFEYRLCNLQKYENDLSHSGHGSTRRNSRFSVQSEILQNSFKNKPDPTISDTI